MCRISTVVLLYLFAGKKILNLAIVLLHSLYNPESPADQPYLKSLPLYRWHDTYNTPALYYFKKHLSPNRFSLRLPELQ
jgi:hypothetical protein